MIKSVYDEVNITLKRNDEWRVNFELCHNGVYKKVSVSVPCIDNYDGKSKEFSVILDTLIEKALEKEKLENPVD